VLLILSFLIYVVLFVFAARVAYRRRGLANGFVGL